MPAIWLLDMLKVSGSNTIVVPYDSSRELWKNRHHGLFWRDSKRANHKRPFNHFFMADGTKRCKLGVSPKRAKYVIGSYDAVNKVLTICFFDLDKDAKYLNSNGA